MGNPKLYSARDIETLKQKIATYRDTLTALKTENSIDDYLFMKSEFNGFKTQILHLEGIMEIMDEKQSIQIEEYERQVNSLSVQIDFLNQTVEELNQDISLIMNNFRTGRSNDHIEAINTSVDLKEPLNSTKKNEENEVNLITEESPQSQTSIPSIQNTNLPPSYKQLQKFVNEAQFIEEIQTGLTSTENIASQKMHQEEAPRFKKQNFPSNSINPGQPYNRPHRKVNMTPTFNLNNAAKKHTFSMNINKNVPNPSLIPTSVPEKSEPAMVHFNPTPDITPIEVEKDIIVISNEVKLETKDKDALSFLKFFRKKE